MTYSNPPMPETAKLHSETTFSPLTKMPREAVTQVLASQCPAPIPICSSSLPNSTTASSSWQIRVLRALMGGSDRRVGSTQHAECGASVQQSVEARELIHAQTQGKSPGLQGSAVAAHRWRPIFLQWTQPWPSKSEEQNQLRGRFHPVDQVTERIFNSKLLWLD